MPLPRRFFFLAVALTCSFALPARGEAQDPVPADSAAVEDSLEGAPEGAFPTPVVDPRITLLGDTLSPADTLRPHFSELPEIYPDSVINPYVASWPGRPPAWRLEGEELVGRGAFSLLDVIESEVPVWGLDLGGGGVSAYLGPELGTPSGVEVFVDGIPAGDPLTTAWDLRQIPLEAIARVEWFPGPGVAAWGGRGTAGVLSITTRRSVAPTARSLLAFMAGSFDTETFSGRFGRPLGWRGDVFVGANFDATDGFLGSGDYTRNQTVIKAGWRPGLAHRLEVARFGDGFSGEDNRFGLAGAQDNDRSTWHVAYVGSMGPLEARAHYYRTSLDIQENFDFGGAVGLIGSGKRSGARVELGFTSGPVRVWGTGAREEEEAASGHIVFRDSGGDNLLDPEEGATGLENPRGTLELGGGVGFGTGDGRLATHVVARRLDHEDWADGGTAWQAAATGEPFPGLTLRVAAGRAQRPPDFLEQSLLRQVADDLGEIHPGRAADPAALETWRDARAEADWNRDGWRVAGRVWSGGGDGAFVWLPPTVWLGFDRTTTEIRLGDVGLNSFDVLDLTTSGVEGEVAVPLPWDVRGRAVVRRMTVEDDRTGEQLPYVPRTQFLGQLRYAERFFPSRDLLIEARLTGRYTGDRRAFDGEPLPSFLATDLLVQGTIINFTIFVSLKNLGGLRYRTEETFFLPGREGFFGINWRFRN